VETDLNDIRACINGDNEAYRRLVQKYEAQIARLMWRFTRDKAECERLVQDVFVEAYLSLKSYRGQGPFLHWLKKIGTRTGYRFWKERDKARQVLSLEDFDTIEKSKQEEFDSDKAAEILHYLFARLPRADRLVLTLMYFEECGTEEIARRMGWTRAGTKMRAMRARGKLKKIAIKEKLQEKLEWMH
jgi:RNA polymerase sigma-70 factor (ECF subfamily)